VTALRVLLAYLTQAGDRSWQAPSTPIEPISQRPQYEVRQVILPVEGEHPVELWFRHYYVTDYVDVMEVTNR